MCHHTLLWVLGAALMLRFFVRMRRWRNHGHGGCGHHHRFYGRTIDLGAPDPEPRFPPWGRAARRWRRWQRDEVRRNEAIAPRPPVDVVGSLELNQRQREIFDDTVTKAKARLAVAELAEALSLVGREPYDREAVEFLVGKGELADDLEQLHFSLTAEQRARLRAVASA